MLVQAAELYRGEGEDALRVHAGTGESSHAGGDGALQSHCNQVRYTLHLQTHHPLTCSQCCGAVRWSGSGSACESANNYR